MKLLAVFLLSALVSLVSGVSNQCARNWTHFQDGCYGYGDTAIPWASAQAICHSYQASLAEVSSLQEHTFLAEMARNKSDNCVWLGGNDVFHDGVWEWPNSPNNFNLFTKWAGGEPNNMNDEDCLNMMKAHDYTWNDEDCSNECNFICAASEND